MQQFKLKFYFIFLEKKFVSILGFLNIALETIVLKSISQLTEFN